MAEGEKLVAHAVLQRAGDIVSIDHFLGHAELLREGVTKLLMFEIMTWLLDRNDPQVQGVRYCLQGAIEDGGRGLMDWKRYTQFKPFALRFPRPGRFVLPADFDPEEYLQLHADVRLSGMDARRHYRLYGVHEGRAWRKAQM